MLSFLLRLFAAVVFFLLAAQLGIHSDASRWAFTAAGAFVTSFLVDGYGPSFPARQ